MSGGNKFNLYSNRPAPAAKSGGGGHRSLLGGIIHDVAGVTTNLGKDVKDAAFGIPTGIVQTVEHPIHSAEAIGKATWHDWSPLFHGNIHQFAHQTYEHPLAPLLDLATVFSAGAGAAGLAGRAAEAAGAEGSLAKAAASLTKASKVTVRDAGRIAKGEAPRPALLKTYGTSAGSNLRRALVNKALKNLESHGRVPKAFEASAREARQYERLHYIDLAHRHAAMNYTINRLMTAGKLASDPSVQHIVQPHVLSQNYWQMRKFAHAIDAHGPIPAGYIAVKEMTDPAMFDHIEGTSLETRLRNFANPNTEGSFVTTAKGDAATAAGGKKILVVPHHTMKALGHEGAESTAALSKFAKSPVTWWKRIQVGYAPRVITNNVMGNWTMYALRTMGSGGGRAIVDAVRHAHGEAAAMKAFKEMHSAISRGEVPLNPVEVTKTRAVESLHENPLARVATRHGESVPEGELPPVTHTRTETYKAHEPNPMSNAEAAAHFTVLAHPHMIDAPNIAAIEKTFGKRVANAVTHEPNWVNRHFATEMGSTFGNVLTESTHKDAEGNIVSDPLRTREPKFVKSGLYGAVHRGADRPVRVASLYHFMRRAPEVQSFLKTHPGSTLDDAISKVLDRNPNALRQRAEAHVRSIAGDYSTLSPRERMIQNFVPFYLWDKHIVKHVANMVNERPGALNALAKEGQMGTETGKNVLGDLPEFMQGALPLSMLGIKGADTKGRKGLLMTTGLNPYHTVGDLAQALTAAVTRHDATSGADAANNLSPLITGIIEQISGHKIGTEAPAAAHGGVLPSVLANMAVGTTYGSLIQRVLGGGKYTPKLGTRSSSHPFGNPQDTLYDHSTPSIVSSLVGLPIREASMARAKQMADQESGRKKHRRTSTNPFGR